MERILEGNHMVFRENGGGISRHQQGIHGRDYRGLTVKLSANEGGNHKNKNIREPDGGSGDSFLDTTKIPRPPCPLYTIIMTDLFYFLSEFYFKNWCKRSTEIIIHTVCLFYSTICCWTKREKLSVGSAVLFGQWTICLRSRTESYHSGLRYNGIWDFY